MMLVWQTVLWSGQIGQGAGNCHRALERGHSSHLKCVTLLFDRLSYLFLIFACSLASSLKGSSCGTEALLDWAARIILPPASEESTLWCAQTHCLLAQQ